jgi:hypothetical protein
MGIGAFGIDPASKFATERKTPKRNLALLYLRIPLPGSGQLSGRVARGSTSRKVACGSAFRLSFSYRSRPPTRANSSVRAFCVPRTSPKARPLPTKDGGMLRTIREGVRLHDTGLDKAREMRRHWQRVAKLILAKEDVMTVSAARIRPLPGTPKLDVSRTRQNESPGRNKFGARPGLGLDGVQANWSVRARSSFDNGAIVRFRYCDISAMALLRQHIN